MPLNSPTSPKFSPQYPAGIVSTSTDRLAHQRAYTMKAGNYMKQFKPGDRVFIDGNKEAGIKEVDCIEKNGYVKLMGSWFFYPPTDLILIEIAQPADLPTAAADTITVSLSDAYEIHTALVAQVIRLTEHIDDPDYEGNTDNLVRIIRETEAVLDRLTAQLQ